MKQSVSNRKINYEYLQEGCTSGIETCTIEYRKVTGSTADSPPHWHLGCEMTYVEKGTVSYMVDGMVRKCEAGDFLFINSGAVHATGNAEPDTEISAIMVQLPDTFLNSVDPELVHPSFRILENSEERRMVKDTMQEILSEVKNPHPCSKLLLNSLIMRLVWMLCAYFKDEKQSSRKGVLLCHEVMEYTMRNYAENLSNETVAAHFGLQETYFNRVFRKQTGVSYHQYLSRIRLDAALSILGEGKASALACALACGFGSEKVMIDWCRKIYGCTPTERIRMQK